MRVRTILRTARISAVWQPVLTALRLPGWPPRTRPVKGLGIGRLRYIRFQFFGDGGWVTSRTRGSDTQMICMFVCNSGSNVVTRQSTPFQNIQRQMWEAPRQGSRGEVLC